MITLLVIFVVVLMMGVPIALSMGAAGLYGIKELGLSISLMGSQLFAGLNSFQMVAIPLFIFMGALMSKTGLTQVLIDFCNSIFGRLRGGLAIAGVAAGAFFAAICGSSAASIASLGAILIPAMKKEGYGGGFSGAVIAAAGSLGPIIPPSILLVLYACQSGESIGWLFMSGVIPGILSAILYILVVVRTAKKRQFPVHEKCNVAQICRSTITAIPALVIPFIIVGGICFGIFTVTESAGITTLYVIVVWFIKRLSAKELVNTIGESVKETAAITFIIGCSTFLAYVITRGQLPQLIVDFIVGAHVSKFVVLLMINALLIILGMLLAPAAALLIVTPLLVPIANAYSINLVQLGLMIVYNLNLGCLTPPVAVSLYMTARMADTSFAEQVKESMPFFAISLIVLLLITYVPEFTLFLPKLLYT